MLLHRKAKLKVLFMPLSPSLTKTVFLIISDYGHTTREEATGTGNKAKIENPLKTGLRQRASLGLSKERLKRRDYASRATLPLKLGKISYVKSAKWCYNFFIGNLSFYGVNSKKKGVIIYEKNCNSGTFCYVCTYTCRL